MDANRLAEKRVKSHIVRTGERWGWKYTDEVFNRKWLERVRAKSIVTESGCLVWQGHLQTKGYGGTTYRGENVAIHRQVYKLLIKADLETQDFVCHSCDIRACWNIEHLWVGKPADNSLDMVKKGRCHEWSVTECPKGHPYDEANTVWGTAASGRPSRECRECMRLRSRNRYWRNVEQNRQRQNERRRAAKGGASQ